MWLYVVTRSRPRLNLWGRDHKGNLAFFFGGRYLSNFFAIWLLGDMSRIWSCSVETSATEFMNRVIRVACGFSIGGWSRGIINASVPCIPTYPASRCLTPVNWHQCFIFLYWTGFLMVWSCLFENSDWCKHTDLDSVKSMARCSPLRHPRFVCACCWRLRHPRGAMWRRTFDSNKAKFPGYSSIIRLQALCWNSMF